MRVKLSRRQMCASLLSLPAAVSAQAANPVVRVYKDPTCGCSEQWVEHLRNAGFAVTVSNAADMNAVKDSYRVPANARSCHTGVVAGYALEGHVPAADVKRLLETRPAGVLGLAVPGMPIGAPGMEVAGARVRAYEVLAFDRLGKTTTAAKHG